mmetsp:Transcript_2471/g.7274  ORF Transcript_2471/g.7274 Transcript_2471/m.7274 type:complete len:471 (-) Transcript_2471:139-1551(-)|eukprot:CAMPEP_0194488528 /NCGR_PEP_ID=MMETSP0253-20130528/8416_1 /TAXON_ID=2966 /ORGANISM="Noctiluca scintillans" /LENGTH=470 /DNA_ID=CAMNT_0039328903 /DNA_START=56 /DNA_END=1468 /DNA_ORIENTATION=-
MVLTGSSSKSEMKFPHEFEEQLAKYASEFVGTFFLVLTIGCNVHTGSIGTALSVGAMLTVMINSLGSVSGAHFNPAVSLAVLVCGRNKISLADVGGYVVSQILGGICAAALYLRLFKEAFILAPVGNAHEGTVLALEVFYTALLCFVVLRVAVGSSPNAYFGLAIGSVVTVAAITIGPITGCSLNPAVTIGSMVAASTLHGVVAFRYWSLYVFGPLFGALVGAGMFILASPPVDSTQLHAPHIIREDKNRRGTVMLRKDDMFELSQNDIVCGCGWRMKNQDEGTDIDVSAVKFSLQGEEVGCVYFANKGSPEEGVWCDEDELHGAAPRHELHHLGSSAAGGAVELDHNEQIHLRLDKIRHNVHAIVFVVTVFSSGKDFKDVHDFFVSVAPEGATTTASDFASYKKADGDKGNAVIVAMVFKWENKWWFKAIDEMHQVEEHSSVTKFVAPCQARVFQTLQGLQGASDSRRE